MREPQVRMLGKKSRGGVSPRLSETEVRKSVLSSRVTFREILVITIYVMGKLLEKAARRWEISKEKLLPLH